MLVIFGLPYVAWRALRLERHVPLVVVQIVCGVLLGPGVLGAWQPDVYGLLFNADVVVLLNGLAWWGVICFVWVAGVELDLPGVWRSRSDTFVTAGAALIGPMALGSLVGLLLLSPIWMGARSSSWQFVAGVGMSCAVTALPILVLIMERLSILRTALGQRVLRYASFDDIAIWFVLALLLLDFARLGRQLFFLAGFAALTWSYRSLMPRLASRDRWVAGLLWLLAIAWWADWAGLHFMVGAFMAGAVTESQWFEQASLDQFRHQVLALLMPVFFLSTGLKTAWTAQGGAVLLVSGALLIAAVGGKLAGVHLAGRLLGWPRGESSAIGWLLQTKALIMIIFANVLLDKHLITGPMFTALLLMAVASTILTTPIVERLLQRVDASRSGSKSPS
jgi:Kef-type K+ transport system membrane component KefB